MAMSNVLGGRPLSVPSSVWVFDENEKRLPGCLDVGASNNREAVMVKVGSLRDDGGAIPQTKSDSSFFGSSMCVKLLSCSYEIGVVLLS